MKTLFPLMVAILLIVAVASSMTILTSAATQWEDADLLSDEGEPTLDPLTIAEEAAVQLSETNTEDEQLQIESADEVSQPEQEAEPIPLEPDLSEEPEPNQTEPKMPEETQPDQNENTYRIPSFYQTDYPDDLYGSGTIKNNGCSVTCLAMVATAMTGHTYTPDELAYYFGSWAENNIQRLEMGSEALGLAFYKAKNADYVWPALKDGKYAIVLMNKKSIFTSSQHFILLTGFNEEGKIMVNDPNRDNYSNWQLANGFENGFSKGDILQGYSGAWIYDPDAMPENPPVYSQPRLDMSHENYPGITLSDEDRRLIASLIWVEARGECAEGQQAVAEVVLNRLVSERFPNNIRDVIFGEGQFHAVETGKLKEAEPWQAQYQAIDRALHGDMVLDKQVFFYATTALTSNVFGVIGNHVFCY